jgi:hypothetical protein
MGGTRLATKTARVDQGPLAVVGAPDRRNLGVLVLLLLSPMLVWTPVLWLDGWQPAGWAALLGVLFLYGLAVCAFLLCEVKVTGGTIAVIRWRQALVGRSGTHHEFAAGDVALRTPRGRWSLNGRPIGMGWIVPGEERRLAEALAQAGLKVHDQGRLWRHDHPVRWFLSIARWPVWLLVIMSPNIVRHLPTDLVMSLAGVWLAMCLGFFVAFIATNPPSEYEPTEPAPTATPAGFRRSRRP